MASNTTWDLEALVDQFTYIPRAKETSIIPEMRWQKSITIFPEPIILGDSVINCMRTYSPTQRNWMTVRSKVTAQGYLMATQIMFEETQQILDLLSIVTSRGFGIHRVRPSWNVLRKLGLVQPQGLKEKLRNCLLRRLEKPIIVSTSKGAVSIEILTAYKEYAAVSKAEGFLEERAIFTTDFPGKGTSEIKFEMLRKDEFDKRLTEAKKNFPKIVAIRKLASAMRLYRVSQQLNDYIVRYILLWTALESATQVPDHATGEKKIDRISSGVVIVPGVMDLIGAKKMIRELNTTRNNIIHHPADIIRTDFLEDLTRSLVNLEWLLYNYLLYRLGLPTLPEISNPFVGCRT